MAAVRCLFCNRNNPVDAKFCNDCGTALASKPCGQCRAANSRAASACRQCGAAFATEAALQTAAAGWSDVRSDLAALLGTVPAWDDAPPPSPARPLGMSKPLPHDAQRRAMAAMAADMDRAAPASDAIFRPAAPSAPSVHHPILIAELVDMGKPRRRFLALAVAAVVIGIVGTALFLLGDENDDIRAASPIAAASRIDHGQSLPEQAPEAAAVEAAAPWPASTADNSLSMPKAVPEQNRDAGAVVADVADAAVIAASDPSMAPSGVLAPFAGLSPNPDTVAPDRVRQDPDRRVPGGGRAASRQADSQPSHETMRSGGALPSVPPTSNRPYANRDRSSKDQASATALPAACTEAAAALGFCQTPPVVSLAKPPNDAAALSPGGKPRASRGEGSAETGSRDSRSVAGSARVCTAAVAALGLCDRGSEAPPAGASNGSTSTAIVSQIHSEQER